MPYPPLNVFLFLLSISSIQALFPVEAWRNSLGANGTLVSNSCVPWGTVGTTLSSPDGASIYYAEMSDTDDSNLYGVRISAADATSGSVLWTWIDATHTFADPSSGPGISLTLSPDGSRLIAYLPLYNYNHERDYFGGSSIIVNGFDALTGAKVYSLQGGSWAYSIPLSSASRLPAIIADGDYAFIDGYDNGTISVRLIDPSTGASRRDNIVVAPLSDDFTELAQTGLDVTGTILIVASYSAVSHAIVINAFSTNTGFQLWSFATNPCSNTIRMPGGLPIALTSEALYVITNNVSTNIATIYGLALRDGADVFYAPAPNSLYLYTNAIAPTANDTLLFSRSDPSANAGTFSVALYDLTTATEIWTWVLPGYGAGDVPALVSADGSAAFVGSLCVSEGSPSKSPCDALATAYAITGFGSFSSAPSVSANPRGLGVFASVPVIEDSGSAGAIFIDFTKVGSGGLSNPKTWGLNAATGQEAWTTDASVSYLYAGLISADADHQQSQYFFVSSLLNESSAATYLIAASIPSPPPAPSSSGNNNLYIYIGAGAGGLVLFLGVVRAAASATRCCSHVSDAARRREGSIDFMYDPLSHDSETINGSGNASVWGKPPPPTTRGFSFKKMFH
jgi:hypothetical protein